VETSAQPGRPALRWLPNALTLARLVALPVLLVVLLRADGPTSRLGALIFGVVAATDLLDGYLARRLHAETRFGRIADPLADRLLVGVALVGVIALGEVGPAAPVILIVRDALTIAGFAWLLGRGVEMRVDMAGKVSSALTMVAAGAAMLFEGTWVSALMWLAVALALVTLANYLRIAIAALRARNASTRP
jgi:CDP-diacylglycerol--glycerol-3-phosphate 3-phosphatidyltransferase